LRMVTSLDRLEDERNVEAEEEREKEILASGKGTMLVWRSKLQIRSVEFRV